MNGRPLLSGVAGTTILATILLGPGCGVNQIEGSGETITEEIGFGRQSAATGVDSVSVDTAVSATVIIDAEAETSVTITGDSAFVERLEATIEDDRLEIGAKDGIRLTARSDQEVLATIVVPALSSLDVGGASSATVSGVTGDVEVRLHGASAAELTGDVDRLTAEVSEASELGMTGNSVVVDATLRAASLFQCTGNADRLITRLDGASTIRCSGSIGGAEVWVDEASSALLDADIGQLTVDADNGSTVEAMSVEKVAGSIRGASVLRVSDGTDLSVDSDTGASIEYG